MGLSPFNVMSYSYLCLINKLQVTGETSLSSLALATVVKDPLLKRLKFSGSDYLVACITSVFFAKLFKS